MGGAGDDWAEPVGPVVAIVCAGGGAGLTVEPPAELADGVVAGAAGS